MRLLKVHRILIGSGMILCVLLGLQQGLVYIQSGEFSSLMRVGAAVLLLVLSVLYLRSLRSG